MKIPQWLRATALAVLMTGATAEEPPVELHKQLDNYPCVRFAAMVQAVVDLKGPARLHWYMRHNARRFTPRDAYMVQVATKFVVDRGLRGKGAYATALGACNAKWWEA